MGSKPSKSDSNKKLEDIGKNSNRKDQNNFLPSVKITNSLISGHCKPNFEKDYKKLELLGKGAFGTVFKVQNKFTKTYGAMKVIPKEKENNVFFSSSSLSLSSNRNDQEILNEIRILQSMDHLNILKVFEYYSNSENFSIVTELCSGGDLQKEIWKRGPFPEDYVAYVMYQIFAVLVYCHSQGIIHRDLKPENVYIFDRNKKNYPRIKVGDFGTAKMSTSGGGTVINEVVGSYICMAPEVLRKGYNEKCDLWSCGVIMYMLICGEPPFKGRNVEEMKESIFSGNYDLNLKPFQKVSGSCKDLLHKLLLININGRPSALQALEDRWFTERNIKNEYNYLTNNLTINNLLNNLKKYKRHSVLQEVALAYLVHNFCQTKNIINACKFFNKIDRDNSGKITQNELYKGLRDYIESDTLADDVKRIFNNLDMDRNGFIECEEFVRASCDKDFFLEDKILKYAFNYFDKDGSGEITPIEVEELLINNVIGNNQNTLHQNIIQVINQVDRNFDGKISFDEFKLCMNSLIED